MAKLFLVRPGPLGSNSVSRAQHPGHAFSIGDSGFTVGQWHVTPGLCSSAAQSSRIGRSDLHQAC